MRYAECAASILRKWSSSLSATTSLLLDDDGPRRLLVVLLLIAHALLLPTCADAIIQRSRWVLVVTDMNNAASRDGIRMRMRECVRACDGLLVCRMRR